MLTTWPTARRSPCSAEPCDERRHVRGQCRQVHTATADAISRGADIALAGEANEGAARAVTEAANPTVRLVWSGLTKDDSARSDPATRFIGRDRADVRPVRPPAQQVDTQSSRTRSVTSRSPTSPLRHWCPVLTGTSSISKDAMVTLIAQARR